MAGGTRPRQGRRPGAQSAVQFRETAYSQRVQKLCGKLLFKKKYSNRSRLEQLLERYLDEIPQDSKEKELQFRTILRMMDFAAGTPQPMAPAPVSKEKDKKVLLLPEKKSLEDWMGQHGQKEVEIVKAKTEEPN